MTDAEHIEHMRELLRRLLTALIWEIDNFAVFGSGAKTKHIMEQLLKSLDMDTARS